MDLPKVKFYGVRCPFCEMDIYFPSRLLAEAKVKVKFEVGFLQTPLGIVIGFGDWVHVCRPQGIG